MRKFYIHNKIYDAPLILYVGGTPLEWSKFVKKKYLPKRKIDEDESFHGEFIWATDRKIKRNFRVIWLPRFRQSNVSDLCVLVHELTHYVVNVCSARNIKVEYDNDEPVAYLFESMLNESLLALKKV